MGIAFIPVTAREHHSPGAELMVVVVRSVAGFVEAVC
jgi:hypothetical protein